MMSAQDIRDLCLALDGKLIALHCAIDPITNETDIHFYTDDGRGNGDHIASMSLEDFTNAHRKHCISCGLGDPQ